MPGRRARLLRPGVSRSWGTFAPLLWSLALWINFRFGFVKPFSKGCFSILIFVAKGTTTSSTGSVVWIAWIISLIGFVLPICSIIVLPFSVIAKLVPIKIPVFCSPAISGLSCIPV